MIPMEVLFINHQDLFSATKQIKDSREKFGFTDDTGEEQFENI
jgi:hypothetical protein